MSTRYDDKKKIAISVDALRQLDYISEEFTKKILAEAEDIALQRNPNDIRITPDDINKALDKMRKSGSLAKIDS